MSLFDDQNDDSLTEIPVFMRIKAKTNTNNNIEINDSNVRTTEAEIERTDKCIETFTLDSDSEVELNCSHSLLPNDVSNDSIQVLYCSPNDANKDKDINDLEDKPIECNTSLRSDTGSTDWTPIKPTFINRTPFGKKKAQNRTNTSVKKCINFLNKRQLNERKLLEKDDKEKQRNERKAQKEMSKMREKAHKEVLKSKSITQSLKYCFAVIDRDLYEMIKQFIDEMFARNECNYRLTDSPFVPMSVTWIRKCLNVVEDSPQCSGQSSQASVADTEVQQNHILVVIESNDFIQRVNSFVNKSGETLLDFVKQVIQKSKVKNITLLVLKLEQYFKRQKTKTQNQFRQRFNELNTNENNCNKNSRQNRRNSMPFVTKEDVDLALIDLELKLMEFDSQSKLSVIKANDWIELTTYIFRYTRSVAESQARRDKRSEQNIGWFAEADKGSTVDPTDPQTHQKLWKKQLMQFPKVSFDVANAIAMEYSTPKALLDRYSRESQPELLLSNIVVSRRQPNGTNTERKVGKELSSRIHTFMTSRNCDQLLDNR